MSIVLIGGHERMRKEYKMAAKKYGCKLKVFTYDMPRLDKCIGCPDCVVMLTDIVSHNMISQAMKICKKKNIKNKRVHNSSLKSIKNTLKELSSKSA